jgi:GntR family transcriptional regulator, phosphonate transport system regulatory protein
MPLSENASPDPLLRGEGVAAWRQIVDGIEADIAGGRIAPGGRLPTEAQLAARFAVNRHTVRRALGVLAARGLVRATQGKGTFVEARPIAYPIGPRMRFSENVSRAGREASSELIGAREIPADAWAAARLGIAEGAPVIEIETRRNADGTPISIGRTVLPLPRFKGFEGHYARTGSITRALAACGVADYTRLSTKITARATSPEEAALLDLTPGRIVLVSDAVNVDEGRAPIQALWGLFPADRVELVIEGD